MTHYPAKVVKALIDHCSSIRYGDTPYHLDGRVTKGSSQAKAVEEFAEIILQDDKDEIFTTINEAHMKSMLKKIFVEIPNLIDSDKNLESVDAFTMLKVAPSDKASRSKEATVAKEQEKKNFNQSAFHALKSIADSRKDFIKKAKESKRKQKDVLKSKEDRTNAIGTGLQKLAKTKVIFLRIINFNCLHLLCC